MMRWRGTKRRRQPGSGSPVPGDPSAVDMGPDLDENRAALRSILGESSDIKFRDLVTGIGGARAMLVFVDGLVDKTTVTEGIIKPLTVLQRAAQPAAGRGRAGPFDFIRDSVLASYAVDQVTGPLSQVVDRVLGGDTAIFLDGHDTALIAATKGWRERQIEEPDTEVSVRSPRDGLTETLRTNTALIRRRVADPNLRIEEILVGTRTKTRVNIMYIRGLANDSLVEEVRRRLGRIRIDSVLASGYIEELIEDNPLWAFPSITHTERPDRVAAALLEGRLAILTDTTPFALVMPVGFTDFLTTNEDYYERYFMASLTRPLRFAAFMISLFLPAFYVAVTTFHQEMIPTRVFTAIVNSREGVPFPAVVEALLMEFTFEVLREGGVRLPRPVGQAVNIVGAIVLGDAAVRASLVSAPMVIVVAVTGISSFAIPSYSFALAARWLRFPIILVAGALGLFGVIVAAMLILIRLAASRSLGYPYLTPFAPLSVGGMKDAPIRLPWWAQRLRPRLIAQQDMTRAAPGLKPEPPREGGENGGERRG